MPFEHEYPMSWAVADYLNPHMYTKTDVRNVLHFLSPVAQKTDDMVRHSGPPHGLWWRAEGLVPAGGRAEKSFSVRLSCPLVIRVPVDPALLLSIWSWY